ncbi:MAG: tRNA (adenosine(37)-N6)-threonylcarbamoyltransferase complex transferase subunit TsaD [Puniceicoccales bacterium]|jgi:N6-L-threonylcarbamoyladenine synthase|nr:tRNA (adenosine(37)-N6)-threonylcarbamoyltransferase complex transferase subunit TsaD [Puniceicoccales bacterium]
MIIGIESSCDESALALFDEKIGVVFEKISSQVELHAEYGGVVPELASREHVKNFVPLLEGLKKFGVSEAKLIAVTKEPGLPGCLNIGLAVARALALILHLPVREVNHLHGHLFSPFIPVHAKDPQSFFSNLQEYLPHLGLLVSGGNTILYEISENLAMATVAETMDDAAGEAFDKGARLLGLPYPGGNLIEKLASSGNPKKYQFPRAFSNKSDMKFSFSGLKTSLRYFLEKFEGSFVPHINDICASYQEAIVDTLATKVSHALEKHSCKSIGISGGVSNNGYLRERISTLATKFNKKLVLPLGHHSCDNAAMIAFAAYVSDNFSSGCRR